jgi:DNA-binding transcriptional LysR family regulator
VVGRHSGALTGTLRISTSVAFGRRVVAPMLIEFMRLEPRLKIDITCEDAYVDLVARGIDVALRMGRLADSSLGGRYIGSNPWVMVASPGYLAEHEPPQSPGDLDGHDCIVYSSVQGDVHSPRTGAACRLSLAEIRPAEGDGLHPVPAAALQGTMVGHGSARCTASGIVFRIGISDIGRALFAIPRNSGQVSVGNI